MAITVQLIALIMLLFVVNLYFLSKRKYGSMFSLAIIILTFIPPDAVGIISGYAYSMGGKINISIIGYDVLIIFLCMLMTGRTKIRNVSKGTFATVVGSLTFIFLFRLIVDGPDVFSNKLLDNYILPAVFALLIITHLPSEEFPRVMQVFFICTLINAMVAASEVIIGRSLFLHDYYMSTNAWYQGIYSSSMWIQRMRGTAFLGHPLINGMYYVLGIVYLYHREETRRKILWLFEFVILIGGVIASNSRGAILIFLGYTAYFLLKRKDYVKAGIALLAVTFTMSIIDFDVLYQRLFSRDISGSSMLHRFISLAKFTQVPFLTSLIGTGFNNTYPILQKIGISGNLENSYLIILLEIGVFCFIAWIISFGCLYSKNMIQKCKNLNSRDMINGMIMCMMGLAFSGNYFGDPGTLNYVLWTMFAMSCLLGERKLVNSIKYKSVSRKVFL